MSTLETILTRAMNEPEFASLLFADADKALAEYNLPADDVARLKGMSRAEFDMLVAHPEERKSFGIIVDEKRGGWDGNHNQSALHINVSPCQ